jgi:4-hydroxybenzoyl-CoA thioesterase
MTFATQFLVRFAHVDPAGIVFFPRYFEMLSAAAEDWFAQSLGLDFATMHLEQQCGVPSVRIDTEFHKPSRLGDELTITVQPLRVGNSSCDVQVHFLCADELRVKFTMTLVWTSFKSFKSAPWPEELRKRLLDQLPKSGE